MSSSPEKKKPSFKVSLLDYGAGNVRSVRNALVSNGYEIEDITLPHQIATAQCIVFPGVGSFGCAMRVLQEQGFEQPLRDYLSTFDRPFLGICLGMQTLFESSDETNDCHNNTTAAEADDDNGGQQPTTTTTTTTTAAAGGGVASSSRSIPGLGVIPGKVIQFDAQKVHAVPHIGWNGRVLHQESPVLKYVSPDEDVYFVHSYYAPITDENQHCILTSTTYNGQAFISAIQRGCVVATQFHPEKSGSTGLHVLKGFLEAVENGTLNQTKVLPPAPVDTTTTTTQLVKRIVVALDVRSNDHGDLVVTKGDQYDVRESSKDNENGDNDDSNNNARGGVRNLGKPVELASRYYQEGADEIAFLNITSFRQGVIEDMPMLQVLEQASKHIFVPLTVGGGIRSYEDAVTGQSWSALEVAARYFRAGADKVSIGSDAVYAAEQYVASSGVATGQSSIEQISRVYGVQAVVVSIDPKRVYVVENMVCTNANHVIVELDADQAGPNGETKCWFQCTVKGGRESRDICAVTLAKAVQALGAGEIMLNCIDMDGQGNGFDLALMRAVSNAVSIPIIASSGAGKQEHFSQVFSKTNVQAALAAGMFHRKEVEIEDVKKHMRELGIPARKRL